MTGSQFKSLLKRTAKESRFLRIFSIISTFGAAENAAERFVDIWSKARLLRRFFGEKLTLLLIVICFFGALCSLPFLYTAFCLCFNALKKRFDSIKHDLCAMPKYELCFYAFMLIAAFVYMTVIYSQSYAFYDPETELRDLIYTSDTRLIARPNAYLSIANSENDLRQPLFALFSAPFIALPYSLSVPCRLFAPYASFYFMNYAQIALLELSIILLALLISENPIERIVFSLVLTVSFPYLLFSLVMEQYVIATFYLILFIYSPCKKQNDAIFLFGAIGTLTTSTILTPLMIKFSTIKEIKQWIKRLFALGFAFVFIMVLFCRGDTLVRIFTEIKAYAGFTGKSIAFDERFMQYFSFVSACFFAPISEVRHYFYVTEAENLSWQLAPATSWSIAGIAIFTFCAVSAAVNRKNLFISAFVRFRLGNKRKRACSLHAVFFMVI